MVKTEKCAGQRKKKEDPLVQCDQCGRWAFLEETEFENVEAANAAARFDCKGCLEISALRRRIQTTEAKVEALLTLVQRLGEQREGAPPWGHSDEVADGTAVNGAAAVHGSQGHIADLHTGPAVPKQPESGRVETPLRERESEENRVLARTAGGDTQLLDSDDPSVLLRSPKGEVDEAEQSRESATAPHNRWHGKGPLLHEGVDVPDQTEGSQELFRELAAEDREAGMAGGGAENVLPATADKPSVPEPNTAQPAVVGTTPPLSNRQLDGATKKANDGKRLGATKAQRGRLDKGHAESISCEDTAREVLIVGDTNASRLTRALQRQLGADRRKCIQWCQVRRVRADDIKGLFSRDQEDTSRRARLVVLHTGLTDVLDGAQPDDIVEGIRESLVPHSPQLIICSVPEVSMWGREPHARAVQLNSLLRQLCSSQKVTFLDLSACTEGEGRIARDGFHFLAETARMVAGLVAQFVTPFLGVPKGKSQGGDRQIKAPERRRTSTRIFKQSRRDFPKEGATPLTAATGPGRRTNAAVIGEEPRSTAEWKEAQQEAGGMGHSIPRYQRQGVLPGSQQGLWNWRPHPPPPVALASGQYHPAETTSRAALPSMEIHQPPFPQGFMSTQQMPADWRLFHMVGDFVRQHLGRAGYQRA